MQLGQTEVARIRELMEATIKETGFSGSFAAFLDMLRTDPRFYPRTPEELLEKASEIAKRADDGLPALFGTLPRLSYGVRPVPADLAEGYTTGRYWPGSLVAGQAGGYMVNTSNLDQRALYELPALTVHEAVPGHHLQVALAQELEAMPYFRRHAGTTAYVEGWGLYAEFLGEEMGIYRTPYERFGRYSYRDVARVPAGRGHGHPLARMGHRAGASVLRGELRAIAAQYPDGARAIHLLAGAGAGLQGRRAALSCAAEGGGREAG